MWQSGRPVPDVFAAVIADVEVPYGLRNGSGVVAPIHVSGIECLVADGYVPAHSDYPAISLMLVLRNDRVSWVESIGTKRVIHQPAGTFVLLNIDREHMLNVKYGRRSKPGVWAAAVIKDYPAWPTDEEVDEDIQAFYEQHTTPAES